MTGGGENRITVDTYFHAKCLIEGQDAIVEQIGGGNRHLGGVDLGEGERAEDIDDDLNVDLAHALERAPEKVSWFSNSPGREASTCRHRKSIE
jgi:hypothetical protein